MMRFWLKVSADAVEESSNRPATPAAVNVIHPANNDFIALPHPLTEQAVLYVVGHVIYFNTYREFIINIQMSQKCVLVRIYANFLLHSRPRADGQQPARQATTLRSVRAR